MDWIVLSGRRLFLCFFLCDLFFIFYFDCLSPPFSDCFGIGPAMPTVQGLNSFFLAHSLSLPPSTLYALVTTALQLV
jgi:hypothetical protein